MCNTKSTLKNNFLARIIYFAYVILGLYVFLNGILLVFVTFPTLIYRFLITKVIAPFFRPNIGEAVSLNSHPFSTEFLKKCRKQPPRCTLVTAMVLEGSVEEERVKTLVQNVWIEARNAKTGELKYPELHHYIEKWMGFMFWKRDKTFDLGNHLHFSDLSTNMSPFQSKQFGDKLMEDLINQPYNFRRSPWSLHFVRNYKDPEYLPRSQDETMTLAMFRCHHSMADGYSIFQLLLEIFGGVSMSEASLASLQQPKQRQEKSTQKVLKTVKFPFEVLHDLGYMSVPFFRKSNPWHCPDGSKKWRQLCSRPQIIPIERVKFIKNKLKCSFMSVIVSSISKCAAHSFKNRNYQDVINSFPFGIALPLPNHPMRLCNHLTGTLFELSTDYTLTPLERLRQVEKTLADVRPAHVPGIMPIIWKIGSFPTACISRFLFKNRYLCTALSSFPGATRTLELDGHKMLGAYFGGGAVDGVAGIAFCVLSYDDLINIVVTAEAAVMSTTELDELVSVIHEEINKLYELCLITDEN